MKNSFFNTESFEPVDLLNFLNKFLPDFDFHLEKQGAGWSRIFIMKGRISLGRINLEPTPENRVSIYGVKSYADLTFKGIDQDSVLVFYQLPILLKTGAMPILKPLIGKAKNIKEARIKEVQKWRRENPAKLKWDARSETYKPKTRPRISTSWLGVFNSLVHEHNSLILEGN